MKNAVCSAFLNANGLYVNRIFLWLMCSCHFLFKDEQAPVDNQLELSSLKQQLENLEKELKEAKDSSAKVLHQV